MDNVLQVLIAGACVMFTIAGCWFFNIKYQIEKDKVMGNRDDDNGGIRH